MKILVHILDILFPPRETEIRLRAVTELEVKNKFLPQQIESTVCLTNYQEPLIRALITENKYHYNKFARRHLATLLLLWLTKQASPVVFIPIPLSRKRQRQRGYNQVTIILEVLKDVEMMRIDTSILRRGRHTTPQTTLGRSERLSNLTGAFICDVEKIQSYQNCTVVIMDDVFTTGATMEAARATLAPHLHPTSKLLCLALAH